MRKPVIWILLIVVFVVFAHNCSAANLYDEYKDVIQKNEKEIKELEEDNEALQAYLDAVDSGNLEEWEKARDVSAVRHAILWNKDKSEIDAVKYKINSNDALIKFCKHKIEISQNKMNIYFHAFILQDMDKINEILDNGNRTIPADISNNIYYAWPFTELPDGLLTDPNILGRNRGNVYLAPATILEHIKDSLYYVDIYGIRAEAHFVNESVSVGETVNIYFSPVIMETTDLSYIAVGESEDHIDSYHIIKIKDDE